MPRARILVVEDEIVVAMDIQKGLTSLGYPAPDMAFTGSEAVRRAVEIHPDVVLMDIRLRGDMDGIEAAEQIRRRLDIPIVYVTAYADEQTLERAKRTQPYGYVLKPFREKDLESSIEVALYKHSMDNRFKRRVRSRVKKLESEREELRQQHSELEEAARQSTTQLERLLGKGQRIRELRRDHPEWTQQRIANEVGVTRAAVGHSLKKVAEEKFPQEDYCGTKEVARILGISRKAVVSRARSGRLKADRFGPGGPWMFRRDYLQSISGNSAESMPPAPLISAADAAAILGVRRRTVWRWARSGRIRAIKPEGSREWRFRIQDAEAAAQHNLSL
jgi:excisionase family DNA binding protein